MPTYTTFITEYIEIAGFKFGTRAAFTEDCEDAWLADQRGADILIPHAAGVLAQQRRLTVTKMAFPIVVDGSWNTDGTLAGSPRSNLTTLMDAIYSAVVAPVGSGDGTRSATWHRSDGSTKTANVHVLGFPPTKRINPWTRRCMLQISVPAGRFT